MSDEDSAHQLPGNESDRKLRSDVLSLIVKQVAVGAPWTECCADLMKAHHIAEADVMAEVRRRARLLACVPTAVPVVFALLFFLNFPVTHRSMLNASSIMCPVLAMLAIQLVYHGILTALKRARILIDTRITLVIAVPTILFATVILTFALLPIIKPTYIIGILNLFAGLAIIVIPKRTLAELTDYEDSPAKLESATE